jgi:hypothetical protein
VCGIEDRQKHMTSLADPSEKIVKGLEVIKARFNEVMDDLLGTLATEYDKTFADVLSA